MDRLWGPLAGPECRRTLSRPWGYWIRLAVALLAAAWLLVLLLILDLVSKLEPDRPPVVEFYRTALAGMQAIAITVPWLLAPSMLAGSFAGEQARGMLRLLLASHARVRDIVWGRVSAALLATALALLALVPPSALLIEYVDLPWAVIAALAALPMGMAVGSGGLALALSSAMARPADALLRTYVTLLSLLIATSVLPHFLPPGADWWVAALNPYAGLAGALFGHDPLPMLTAAAGWTCLGMLSLAWTMLRLRRNYLWQDGGPRRARTGRKLPPVGNHPLVWKELHVEQAAAGGPWSRWLMRLLLGAGVVLLAVSPIAQAAGWAGWSQHALLADMADVVWVLVRWMGYGLPWMVPLMAGVRASTSIAGERQRDTWDLLLATPMEAREIVWGKLIGSVWSLRWLFGLTVLVQVALALGDTEWLAAWLGNVLTTAAATWLLAVKGLSISLRMKNATQAMSLLVASWMGYLAAAVFLAGVVYYVAALIIVLTLMRGMHYNLDALTSLIGVNVAAFLAMFSWYVLLAALHGAAAWSLYSPLLSGFDRATGRMAPWWTPREPLPPAHLR